MLKVAIKSLFSGSTVLSAYSSKLSPQTQIKRTTDVILNILPMHSYLDILNLLCLIYTFFFLISQFEPVSTRGSNRCEAHTGLGGGGPTRITKIEFGTNKENAAKCGYQQGRLKPYTTPVLLSISPNTSS